MPELPEVETIVREMREAQLVGKKITKAVVHWHKTIALPDPKTFCHQITNQTIRQIERRGKFLVFTLSHDTLLVHLRMTGKFIFTKDQEMLPHSHERVRLYLDDGRLLCYEDQRKFGKWHLTQHPEEVLSELGIEPLSAEFTQEAFQDIVKGRTGQIKPFLLDQHHVAGLGNIYVDEALWEAKIHPLQQLNNLSTKEINALHHAIQKVLEKGVTFTGTSLGSRRANYYSVSGRRGENQNFLNVFRQDGFPCPRCQTTLIKIVVAQRGTHLCPTCQKI